MEKRQQIWFAVNKNDHVVMFIEEPIKNEKLGKWESKYPYINSSIYKEICSLVQQSKMNWNSESQCIEISISY